MRSLREIFFQCDHPSVTSSRRHFVKSSYWPYLPNGKLFLNQIWHTLTSGQGSTPWRARVRACPITYAYARVKIKKCSKWLHSEFTLRFRPFWAFFKFPRVRVRARVFSPCSTYGTWKRRFFTCFGFLILLSTMLTNSSPSRPILT